MRQLGFVGYNVTIPHKEDIGVYLDVIDDVASEMGAVNTVIIDGKRAIGTNTDWIGIAKGLVHHGHPTKVGKDRSAVVLGSGGAARAAIYALNSLGYAKITVFYLEPEDAKTARLRTRAEAGSGFTLETYDSVDRAIAKADVVCNMTSAGMHGNDPAPFDLARIADIDLNGKWFFDAVFNPLDTPFLQAGARGGAMCVDGLWMMIYQGIPAFESWTNRQLTLKTNDLIELHRILRHALADV
ncbi:hypothetical protein AWC31_25765 [Mycolicibacterium wolinskyi]|uniref:Shikimate dehydrogenase substrate binding N-terminal domain-containing protein n=2 Tax=Mycobacteriaceae TaxID=1762 RepID=A0A1X2F816_9MYCO|nr:hypothetical protein AWC31_25765 [Mycolicibacterium wolinskyi]